MLDGVLRGNNGTPPPARGGLGHPYSAEIRGRNTPACAGRTASRRGCRPRSAEHPRLRGEDRWTIRPRICCVGTPPPARGGRLDSRHAYEGGGTPPPARGGRGRGAYPSIPTRNTPACAGRTAASCAASARRTEHPRLRGEDGVAKAHGHGSPGTPPPARGGREHPGPQRSSERNTPACAGRTPPGTAYWLSPTEHPRLRGEDEYTPGQATRQRGTPPPARGGQQPHPAAGPETRNTPACAGRTRRRPEPRPPGRGTPPPARGGLERMRERMPERRNTPACAGRTLAMVLPDRTDPEHPRLRGEDNPMLGLTLLGPGTPPPARGGRTRAASQVRGRRNTPACAGRTPARYARR